MLDKFRETAITWDKATSRIYSPVTANASDSNGRKLNIQVVNSGQIENLTGTTLHLYWETKDKSHYGLDAFNASDISKGEFEIFYTTGMLSNVGELNATLVLVDSTGKVVSDWFKITVTRGINEDAIESENSFSSLTQALIDISNLEQNYAPRLNDLTAQLQQTKYELETTKLDKGQNESITIEMLDSELKETITNGEWNFAGNTSDIEPKAITKSKLGLTDDYLPQTVLYSRGDNYGFSFSTRAHSDSILLPVGTIITTTNVNAQFSLYYADGTSPTHQWEKEHVITLSKPVQIIVRKTDNSNISDQELNLFSDYISISTPHTSVKRHLYEENMPINLNFEYGSFSGVDGSVPDPDLDFLTRVRTREYFTAPKGSKISIKDTQNTSYALYLEGDNKFHRAGWTKEPTILQESRRIKILQKFDSDALVKDNFVFFKYNLEITTPDTLIRGKDVDDFVSGIILPNDPYTYPITPVWGYEYMFSWYDKIRKNQPVKMTWAGDSTTLNGGLDPEYVRSELGKKIMTLSGYDESLVTSINAGHGTQHTGNWLGGDKDEDKRTPNGFLDEDMQENPDLYIFGYGFNDGSNSHFPSLTWEERIDRFEENLNEGLERIRGSMYNKSPDDMAIILTTPIAAYSEPRGNTPQVWNDKIRPIIQKACRDYHCAFVDITARQYDHSFSSSWSTGGDWVHPNETANVDYMSMFDEIIMPRLLHKQ